MPIVFSAGENPVPLALMGLNEGVNVFVDEDGKPLQPTSTCRPMSAAIPSARPAAARTRRSCRSASIRPSDLVGEFDEGEPLFDGDKPSEHHQRHPQVLRGFRAGRRSAPAPSSRSCRSSDLLIDGEVSIQPNDAEQPFIYRGFRMVDEEKLRELRGDQLRKINQNGMLPLIIAHLFSLSLMRDIFGQQMAQGKVPRRQRPAAASRPTPER